MPNENKVEDFAKVSMLTDKESAISLECSWHASAGEDAVISAIFMVPKVVWHLKTLKVLFMNSKPKNTRELIKK